MITVAILWLFTFSAIEFPTQVYVSSVQAECEKARTGYKAQGYKVSASCVSLDLAVLPSGGGLLF